MASGGSQPAPPDYYKLTQGELQAKTDLAPNVYATEAQYDPMYGALNVSNLHDVLEGTAASSRQLNNQSNTPGFINNVTGEFVAGDTPPNAVSGKKGAKPQLGQWVPSTQQSNTPVTVNTPATPGLLDLAGDVSKRADEMAAASATRQRTGNVSDLATLGPDAVKALMSSDPQTAMLMNQLAGQASGDLASGTNLTPAQMRLVQQDVRQGQSARGMGFGPADMYGEALGVSQFGQGLLQQRIGNASQVASQRYAMYGAPANNLLSQNPQPYGNQFLQTGYGISSGIGPHLFGTDMNAENVASTAYNGQVAAANSANNSAAALNGAGISAGAAIGGSVLAALI